MPIYMTGESLFVDGAAGGESEPQITSLADGRSLITYRSFVGSNNTFETDVVQQLLDRDGTPIGAPKRIDESSVDWSATVLPLESGGWVTVWSSYSGGPFHDVFQQVFDAEGNEAGGTTRVNAYLDYVNETSPAIISLSGGGWIVYYLSSHPTQDRDGISYRVFDATGTPSSGAVPLLSGGVGVNLLNLKAISCPDGGWVLTWQNSEEDGAYIFQQQFDVLGRQKGLLSQLNDGDVHRNLDSVSSLSDGGWIVTTTKAGSSTDVDLFFQRYDANGQPVGAEIEILPEHVGIKYSPTVQSLQDGGWVLVYVVVEDFSDYFIWQQRFNADGTESGPPVRVNDIPATSLPDIDVEVLTDGSWTVAWNDAGVHVQRYATSAPPLVSNPIDDLVIDEDQGLTFVLPSDTFTDADTNGLEYSVTLANGENLPLWLQFDPVTKTFSGTPSNNDVGQISIKVTVTDGSHFPASDVFTITVKNTNDLPEGTPTFLFPSGVEDQPYTVTSLQLLQGFSDADIGDTLRVMNLTAVNAAVSTSGEGGFFISPDENFHGGIEIRYLVSDDHGGSIEAVQTLTFVGVNDAPTAHSETAVVAEDTSYFFSPDSFGFSDVDGHNFAGITVSGLSGNGTLKLDGQAVAVGDSIKVSDIGMLSWQATADLNGAALEAFSFVVIDDGGTDNGGSDTSKLEDSIFFNVTEVVDIFSGTRRADYLEGTSGDDIFLAGRGKDRLMGGSGSDRFVFSKRDGKDRVLDFEAEGELHDVIDLSGSGRIKNFRDLMKNHAEKSGDDVRIDGLKGDVLILENVTLKELDQSHFDF